VVAGVCVVHDLRSGSQKFFTKHSREISCIAIHPVENVIATGEMGGDRPSIYIWNADFISHSDLTGYTTQPIIEIKV
jgi:hypothetical protein